MPACEISPVQHRSPDLPIDAGGRQPGRDAEPDERERARRPARSPRGPIAASASSRSDAPTATKNTTSTGSAPRWIADLERVALRHRDVLNHEARGHRRQQRLEPLRGADLAEQRAHAEQHQRHLAPDVAQIQREQRADQAAERNRAADLPGEPHQHAHVRRRPGSPRRRAPAASRTRTARARRDRRARRSPAPVRSGGRARRSRTITAAVIVGEKLTTMIVNSATIASFAVPAGVRRDRQPRPRQPRDGERCPPSRRRASPRSSARCRRAAAEPLEVQRQAGDQRDQRRRDAR